MNSLSKSILRTLAYADVFDHPLTTEEIHRFLIEKKASLKQVEAVLSQLSKINSQTGFCFLKGKKKIVSLRKKRERASEKKLKLAQRVGDWLRLIPWIRLVGVTGALSMKAAKEQDDIDLLIVTARNRLWLTRLLAVLLVELVAKRRRPGDKEVKDRICLNMFLDEDHLGVPRKERDLFSAHEVCQLMVLWEKGRTYQKFLKGNQWVAKFLPNWRR